MLVSRWFQPRAVSGILVADIVHSSVSTDDEPFEAAADGFDEVPGVEGVHEGFDAEGAA